MFTGLVQAVGSLKNIILNNGGAAIRINLATLASDNIKIGDSIAVNGVCLTVSKLENNVIDAFLSNETLAKTNFKQTKVGALLNLELCVTPTTCLGGHLVMGHIDGVAIVENIIEQGECKVFTIRIPKELLKYTAVKGSICINGISLTVNEVIADKISCTLIPHTLAMTNLGVYKIGDSLNIEMDSIARYCERLLNTREISYA